MRKNPSGTVTPVRQATINVTVPAVMDDDTLKTLLQQTLTAQGHATNNVAVDFSEPPRRQEAAVAEFDAEELQTLYEMVQANTDLKPKRKSGWFNAILSHPDVTDEMFHGAIEEFPWIPAYDSPFAPEELKEQIAENWWNKILTGIESFNLPSKKDFPSANIAEHSDVKARTREVVLGIKDDYHTMRGSSVMDGYKHVSGLGYAAKFTEKMIEDGYLERSEAVELLDTKLEAASVTSIVGATMTGHLPQETLTKLKDHESSRVRVSVEKALREDNFW